MTAITVHLMENLETRCQILNIGFYEGRQYKKRWLCCQDDLYTMYSSYKDGGEITLWRDGRKVISTSTTCNQPVTRKLKQKASSRCQENEEVDTIFIDLKDKHNEKYDNPKLRLWARMIASGLHESTDEPPNVPAFVSEEPKRRKESLTGALTWAVEAIAKAMGNKPQQSEQLRRVSQSDRPLQMGVSSGKAVELRMKNLEQLRYLQGLYEDKILSDKELAEQKRIVLEALRKLT